MEHNYEWFSRYIWGEEITASVKNPAVMTSPSASTIK
jgi:hypothetical protein